MQYDFIEYCKNLTKEKNNPPSWTVQWKFPNIVKLKKQNPEQHKEQLKALENTLRNHEEDFMVLQ